MTTATQKTPASVYLHLFHGRNKSTDNTGDDWGFQGPSIGPLDYVHTTYATHINFECSPEVMEKFFGVRDSFVALEIINGCVEYDGKFYGDWTVSTEEGEE